jgi:hypothetical protein
MGVEYRTFAALVFYLCIGCDVETPPTNGDYGQAVSNPDGSVTLDSDVMSNDASFSDVRTQTPVLDAHTLSDGLTNDRDTMSSMDMMLHVDGQRLADTAIASNDALLMDAGVDGDGALLDRSFGHDALLMDAGVDGDGASLDTSFGHDALQIADAAIVADLGPGDSETIKTDLAVEDVDMAVQENPCNDPIAGSRCRIGGRCVLAGTPLDEWPCRVCLPAIDLHNWSVDETSPVCLERGFWTDVDHASAQTPHGRRVGIVCHNCYHQPNGGDTSAGSEASTRVVIRNAQFAGADLIELDLKEQDGQIYVDHDDDGGVGGSHFATVLQNADLRDGTQPLYLELKELEPRAAFVETMLRDLMRFGFAVPGRPVFLRAFYDRRESLLLARQILAGAEFAPIRPHVRLNVLFRRNDPAAIAGAHDRILEIQNMAMHGVEFYYDDDNLLSKVAYARSLFLGVTLFTVPVRMGEVFIANSRDLVDALVVDYPIAATRTVIEEETGLVNLDMAEQDGAAGTIRYQRTDAQYQNLRIDGADGPDIEILGPGEDRFGGSLVFDANQEQSLTVYDADTAAGQGYFVSVLANFDDLDIPGGETRALVAKSDGGGFAIELYNPPGLVGTVLRFGVRVGGRYYYATYPAAALNGTDAFWITGAYDGDGAVRMWVNNSDDGVTTSEAVVGGVVNNNSPIVIGADPQGAEVRRFHSSAKIQRVNVQRWRDH